MTRDLRSLWHELGLLLVAATTGSDSNGCAQAQNIATPKRNIIGGGSGIACLQIPGDKLLIRAGTYEERINNYTDPFPWPTGSHAPMNSTALSTKHTIASSRSTLRKLLPLVTIRRDQVQLSQARRAPNYGLPGCRRMAARRFCCPNSNDFVNHCI
jgi:hypothetical protein